MLNVKSYYININYNYKNINNVFFYKQIEIFFETLKKFKITLNAHLNYLW